MTHSPKDHPTFKRAMQLAHRRLMARQAELSERIEQLQSEGADPRDAGGAALSEMAQRAFDGAVESLAVECARRARVEYRSTGKDFLAEAIRGLPAGSHPRLARAFKSAAPTMPASVLTVHEFGLREDGLAVGTTRNIPQGGDFSGLGAKLRRALEAGALAEAKARILAAGSDPAEASLSAKRLVKGMGPALDSTVRRCFPSDFSATHGRSLCCFAQELCSKLARLEWVEISCDAEARHVVSGPQAAARILDLSGEASDAMRGQAAFSRFLLGLGQ